MFSNIFTPKVFCSVMTKSSFFAVKLETFCPFQDFQGLQPKFKDFPGPGIFFCQFQDFPGFSGTVATLCNVTVAKWIILCSQHIVLVIWIEFPPKLYQVTLPLTRKEKLLKHQEIPIISAEGKKQFHSCPWSQTRLAAIDYQKLFTLHNGKFGFTGNSQLSHLFRLANHLSRAPLP